MPIPSHRLAGFSENREPNDYYPTPEYATEALFSVEEFEGAVLEPAAGDGTMANVINRHNPCVAKELLDGHDFLLETEQYPNVVTNPPFKLAQEFVEKAKTVADKKVALFLKLVFLEGQCRQRMFRDTVFPLARVHVFSKRVTLYAGGRKGKNSGTMAFAWFVWDKEHVGPPIINWI